jgi:hypothetical protein
MDKVSFVTFLTKKVAKLAPFQITQKKEILLHLIAHSLSSFPHPLGIYSCLK